MKKVALYLLFLMVALTINGQNVPRQAQENPLIPGANPHFPSSSFNTGFSPVVLPSSYDLRAFSWMTSVKDQGDCAAGWAFATMAALEMEWKKQGYSDTSLSENNLKNCHGFSKAPCSGGTIKMATAYLTRMSGPVSEISDPYSPVVQSCVAGLTPLAYVSDIRLVPNDILTIKQEIYNQQALYSAMYWTSSSYNSSNFTYYYSGALAANHAVTLVGWNDNKVTAGGAGAWIAKNSFGSSWGESGYFYISYNDTRILSENALFPYDSRLPYLSNSTLYSYDDLGWVQSWGYGTTEAYGLMKFVATNDNGLSKIGTWVVAGNSTVDIEIYDNFTGTALSNLLLSIPNQSCPYPGYYSFSLPNNEYFNLITGNDYYIKVKYTTPDCINPIPSEMVSPGYSTNATIQTGKCWMSGDGMTWDAVGGGTPYMLDLCIKAYTYKSMDPVDWVMANVQAPPLQHVQLYFYSPGDQTGLSGFNVYRDNVKINTSLLPTWYSQYYDDYNVPFCEHTYTIKAVYGSVESLPSQPSTVMIGNRTVFTDSFEHFYLYPIIWTIENLVNPASIPLITLVTQNPTCPTVNQPYDSAYLIKFASCAAGQNERARLKRIIPFSTIGLTNVSVDFAWYQSSLASWASDGVDLQWSTDGNTWSTAGSFPRYSSVNGWDLKTVNLPPEAAGKPAIYIAFLFKAANDNTADCLLDLVRVTSCGPPLPGFITVGWSSGSVSYPYTTGSMDARTQMIYIQDDMLDAGAYPGMISQIGFYVPMAISEAPVMHNFQIKLKNTTQQSLSNWVSSGMTTVYSGDYQVNREMNWNMITLQTPFYYDTSNLLVEICFDNNSTSSDIPVSAWCCTGAIFHDHFNGTGTSGCSATAGSVYTYLPTFRIYMTPVVQGNINLQNVTVEATESTCYDAVQTITLAGNGTIFKVKNGGHVDLIAGQNIRFYPGASVEQGGYLLGHISTNGQYCGYMKSILDPNPEEANQQTPKEPETGATRFFRIFPNPTTDSFTLTLNAPANGKPVYVEVYSILGEKILTQTLTETSRHLFTLQGKPSGIYLVKVVSAGISEVQKVVKQ